MSLLGALAASAVLAAPAAAARPAEHVFIIMLDGTRPDFLRRARAPVIPAYAARYAPEVSGSVDLALWYKQWLSRDLLDQTLVFVREHKPNLVVINLGSPDYVAHTWGPEAPQYLHTIEFIDGLLGELKAELGKLGILERTAFVISADHGFSDVDPTRMIAPAGDAARQSASADRAHTLDPLAAR